MAGRILKLQKDIRGRELGVWGDSVCVWWGRIIMADISNAQSNKLKSKNKNRKRGERKYF